MDDELDVRKSIKTILENEGFEVVSVSSGVAALEKMAENTFDLILLDVMMPDMSGWEVFTYLTEINKKFRVIFLTVLGVSQERLVELRKSGIRDYIVKPFDREDFVARVKKALKR